MDVQRGSVNMRGSVCLRWILYHIMTTQRANEQRFKKKARAREKQKRKVPDEKRK